MEKPNVAREKWSHKLTLTVKEIVFFQLPMETRLPFQYGIASVTHLPHIFVRVTAEVNGRHASGLSSENLAPKWFTKDPDTSFEDHDLPRMMMSLRHAAALSLGPSRAVSFFDWWYCVYQGQMEWAAETGTPPLLASLGVSLLERAVLDACCRDAGTPLFDWLRTASHGIEPAALRPGTSHSLVDILPAAPISKIHLRHTVGRRPVHQELVAPANTTLRCGHCRMFFWKTVRAEPAGWDSCRLFA